MDNRDTPVTAGPPILDDLIRHARRRAIWQTALARSLWAVTAALAAEALLLVLGTGLLAWYIPLVAFALALGAVSWTLRGRLPDDYGTAQRLDSALHTSDLLSSAWYMSTSGVRSHFAPFILERAEAAARVADPGTALPWRWPRSSRWMSGMALVTLALFGVRYGVLHTLDLSGSVVNVMFDTFTGQSVAASKKPANSSAKLPQPIQIGLNEPGDVLENNPPEDVLKNYEVAGQTNSGSSKNVSNPSQQTQQRETGESSSPEEESSNVNLPEGAKGASTGANQQKSGDVKNPPKPDARQKKDSSLLDKMRDAMASMMDKLKLNSQTAESQQSAAAQEAQRQAQRQSDKGSPSQGKPQQGDPQGQQSQQQADSSQSGQKSQTESQAQNSDGQQHSGIGKQDGSKDTEMAKDAEAMGKLSELIGKRSMNLQGEMTVEVENTRNPQLRTPYLNRSAAHGEAGGDLSRDEVPLRHQEFVRRYYEQVRKQPDSLVPAPHKAETKP